MSVEASGDSTVEPGLVAEIDSIDKRFVPVGQILNPLKETDREFIRNHINECAFLLLGDGYIKVLDGQVVGNNEAVLRRLQKVEAALAERAISPLRPSLEPLYLEA